MLSVLVFLPLAGGLVATALGGRPDGGRRAGAASLVFALATLGLSIALITTSTRAEAGFSTWRTSPGSRSSAFTTGSA